MHRIGNDRVPQHHVVGEKQCYSIIDHIRDAFFARAMWRPEFIRGSVAMIWYEERMLQVMIRGSRVMLVGDHHSCAVIELMKTTIDVTSHAEPIFGGSDHFGRAERMCGRHSYAHRGGAHS